MHPYTSLQLESFIKCLLPTMDFMAKCVSWFRFLSSSMPSIIDTRNMKTEPLPLSALTTFKTQPWLRQQLAKVVHQLIQLWNNPPCCYLLLAASVTVRVRLGLDYSHRSQTVTVTLKVTDRHNTVIATPQLQLQWRCSHSHSHTHTHSHQGWIIVRVKCQGKGVQWQTFVLKVGSQLVGYSYSHICTCAYSDTYTYSHSHN